MWTGFSWLKVWSCERSIELLSFVGSRQFLDQLDFIVHRKATIILNKRVTFLIDSIGNKNIIFLNGLQQRLYVDVTYF